MKSAFHQAAILLICVKALAADLPAQTREIGLEDAINIAVSNNLSMMASHFSLASSEVTLQSQLDRFKINVRPELYSEQSDGSRTDAVRLTASRDTAIGTTFAAAAGTRRSSPADSNAFYRTSVIFEIRQPLLRRVGTLINLEPIRDADRAVRNSRRELLLRQTDLIVEVVEAHESLLSLQRQIDYQTKTIERLEQFYRLTSAREKQGRSTRVDTMRADLRLGNAKLRMASLQDSLVAAQSVFAELLGSEPSEQFCAMPSETVTIETPDPETATALALSNRLDYAQILDDFEDAKRGIKIARRNLLPDLRVIARYELMGEDESYSESSKLDDEVWFVGFQLASDFPLRSERSELATAQLTAGLSELRTESVELAIKKQVRQALSAYQRVIAEKNLAEKNHQIARDRMRLAQKLFEMGKGDSFSVSESEDELLTAEDQLLSSQSAASVASYRLMRITGTLMEYPDELKPGSIK